MVKACTFQPSISKKSEELSERAKMRYEKGFNRKELKKPMVPLSARHK